MKAISRSGKVRILAILFLVLSRFSLCALDPALAVHDLHFSASTAAGMPGDFLIDQDPETAWGFQAQSTEGWVEIVLDSPALIYGLELAASLSAEDRVQVEFRHEGTWIPFSGGLLRGAAPAGSFLDLSFDSAVTDVLRLSVFGPDLASSRLSELRIYGQAREKVLHKVRVQSISADANTAWFGNEESLTDGDIFTSWVAVSDRTYKPENDILRRLLHRREVRDQGGEFPDLEDYLDGFDKKYAKANGESFTAEAILDLGGDYRLENINLYFTAEASGDVSLFAWERGDWVLLDQVREKSVQGWRQVNLYSDATTARIKVKIEGFGRRLVAISEVELWGFGGFPGDAFLPIVLPPQSQPSRELNLVFQADPDKDRVLEIELARSTRDSLAVEVNGRFYTSSGYTQLQESRVYEFPIPAQEYWRGDNFLRFPSSDSEETTVTSARLRERFSGGVQRLIPGDMGDGALFSSKPLSAESIYELDRAVFLKRIEVCSPGSTPVGLFARQGEEWIELPWMASEPGIRIYRGGLTTSALRVTPYGELQGEIRILGSPTADQPPEVRILWPRHNAELLDEVLHEGLVIGFVDNPGSQVQVNGISARKEGHFFWVKLKELSFKDPGLYEITATATDPQKRTGRHAVRAIFGRAFSFWVNLPETVTYTADPSITVEGTLTPWSERSLAINGQEAEIGRKEFSRVVPLRDGLNIIELEVRHRSNGRVELVLFRKVFRVSSKLFLAVDSPRDNSYLSGGEVRIYGRVFGFGSIAVIVNGRPAEVAGGRFASPPIALHEGTNRLVLSASDALGSRQDLMLTVNRDSTPPLLELQKPRDGGILAASTVQVAGSIHETNQAWVYVNQSLATRGGENFSTGLSFADGFREVVVTARDIAGNRAAPIRIRIIVDTTPPEPFVVVPDAAGWSNNPRPLLTFGTTDATSGIEHYELSLDEEGLGAVASPHRMDVLLDGEHIAKIRAIDRAGWFREAAVTLYIDTTPPLVPNRFRPVPGNGEITLKWLLTDDDVVRYRIRRAPAWSETEALYTSELWLLDPGLENGQSFSYELWAIDRAGNESAPGTVEQAIAGLKVQEYEAVQGASVEYGQVIVTIPPESLPPEVKRVLVTEVQSQKLEELAFFPFLSPIYDFRAELEQDGQVVARDHVACEKEFLGTIAYEEDLIPEDFPEENLGVFYFDEVWMRWFKVPKCAVDKERNLIVFATNHFSAFTVQPTMIEDLSPQEIQDVKFSPMGSGVRHDGVSVSPQGGSATTQMTELVLPGKNGFDFVLKRTYDSATARGDAPGLALNLQIKLSLTGSEGAAALGAQLAGSALWSLAGQFEQMIKKYFQSNGDYSYSMGLGWRLNLPYIRGSNSSVLVRLPSGSFYSTSQMKAQDTFDMGGLRTLVMENHEGEDFTLRVTQARADVSVTSLVTGGFRMPGWQLVEAELVLKDGSTYFFDPLGRLLLYTDPSGRNRIEVHYNGLELDYIEDSLGRKVRFEYTHEYIIPKISRIRVENDAPYNRQVVYELQSIPTPGWALIMPLLVRATDVGGRRYDYSYKEYFLLAGGGSVKVNVLSLILAFTPYAWVNEALGIAPLTLSGNVQTEWVFPLRSMKGPGIGYTRIENDNKLLSYSEMDADDYFLGFIPTAVTFTYQLVNRMFTDSVALYASDSGELIKTTTYQYDVRYYDHQQFHNYSTVESDGKITSRYSYNATVKRRDRYLTWSDWVGDVIQGKGFTSRPDTYDVVPFNTLIIRSDAGTGSTLETVDLAYDLATLRLASQTTTRGLSVYRQQRYSYDAWGNVTYTIDLSRSGDRPNRMETWSYFYNTGSSPGSGVTWRTKPYSPFPDGRFKNLPAGTVIRNHVPPEAESGEYVELHTYYDYEASSGLKTGEARWSGQEWAKTSYERDTDHGSIRRTTSATGHAQTIDYDYSPSTYYTITTTDHSLLAPDGSTYNSTWVRGYHRSTGWLLWEVNPRGYVTETSYDALGRLVSVVRPDDNDSVGWDPRGGQAGFRSDNPVQTIEYNDAALWTRVTSLEGRTAVYDYDNLGRLVEIDRQNRSRDRKGQLSGDLVEHATTAIGYSPWNEILWITDPNGRTTSYEYDALGRNVAVTYPEEGGTRPRKTMGFDYASGVATVVDERGNLSYESYDWSNRLVHRAQLLPTGAIDTYTYFDGFGNQVATLDGNGNKTIQRFNPLNLLDTILSPEERFFQDGAFLTFRPFTRKLYDSAGFQVAAILGLPGGGEHRTDLTVDGLGRPIRTTVPYTVAGEQRLAVQETYYDAAGNKLREVDANNTGLPVAKQKAICYAYSARNQVLEKTDTAGNITRYRYNLEGEQVSMTDARGSSGKYDGDFTILCHYDDLGRLVAAELPVSAGESEKPLLVLRYDRRGNLLEREEPDGGRKTFSYTPRNKVATETASGARRDGIALTYTTTHIYDLAGNETTRIDPSGDETRMSYDTVNRLSSTRHPGGNTERITYDKNGNRLTVTDGNGQTTTHEYDSFNRLAKTIDALGHASVYAYDVRGNRSRVEDPNGNVLRSTFDELSRLAEELSSLGYRTLYRYDGVGNLVYKLDPNGTEASYRYTDNYLLERQDLVNPASGLQERMSFTYDEVGNRITSDNGHVLSRYNTSENGIYRPDPYGRIRAVRKELAGRAYSYGYDFDVMGRIIEAAYPNGRRVPYSYNNLGQLEGMAGWIEGPVTYNPDGLPQDYTAANQVSRHQVYDRNDRLTEMRYVGANGELKSYLLAYDQADNLLRRNSSSFVYDELNRLVFSELYGSFQIDVSGRRQQVGRTAEDYSGEEALSFPVQDVEIGLDSQAASLGVDLRASYRVHRMEIHPLALDHRLFEGALSVFAAEDNQDGAYQRVDGWSIVKDKHGTVKILFGEPVQARYLKVHCYYDDRDDENEFLNAATARNRASELLKVYYLVDWRTESFAYDPNGNRLHSSVSLDQTEERSYTYYRGSDRLKSDGRWGYVYDRNGNLTAKGAAWVEKADGALVFDPLKGAYWEYGYDLWDRMVEVRKADAASGQLTLVAKYTYDADGLRLMKESAGEGSTFYLFSTNGALLYREQADDSHFEEYVYAFDKLFAVVSGQVGSGVEERRYVLTDELGSAVAITDGGGRVLWQDELSPFGESSGAIGLIEEQTCFAGKILDAETGLYYFNARWYDPEIGRFISEDPARDGENWYAYVENNPLTNTDPTGLLTDFDRALLGAATFFGMDREKVKSGLEAKERSLIDRRLADYQKLAQSGQAAQLDQEQQRLIGMMGDYNRDVVPTSTEDYMRNSRITRGAGFEQIMPGVEESHPGIDLIPRAGGAANGLQTPWYALYQGADLNHPTGSNPMALSVPGTDVWMRVKHADTVSIQSLGSLQARSGGFLAFRPRQTILDFPLLNNGISSTGPHFHLEMLRRNSTGIPQFANPVTLQFGNPDDRHVFYSSSGRKIPTAIDWYGRGY